MVEPKNELLLLLSDYGTLGFENYLWEIPMSGPRVWCFAFTIKTSVFKVSEKNKRSRIKRAKSKITIFKPLYSKTPK